MAIDRNNISLSLSLNILKALGGDTSIEYDSTEAVWEAIDTIYAQSGDRVIVEELILDVVENGNYDYFGNENVDAYAPVQISVNVPQKYTDEQVGSLVETARAEGEATGFANGVADQKSKLESITISQNGTYTNEDGYDEINVNVVGEVNFDFGVLGYDNTVAKQLNNDIATTTQNGIDYAIEIANKGISGTSMSYMNDLKLVYFPMIDTSQVKDMKNAFKGCAFLQYLPDINTQNVTSMYYTFSECSSLTTIPQLDTSNVTNMYYAFDKCSSLTTIPQLDTSNVTNMQYMFNKCFALTTIPQLDTSKITDMTCMFSDCSSLTTIPQLDTSNVKNMQQMFYNCSSLTTIPQLDTSNVKNMSGAFSDCINIDNVPEIDCSKVAETGYLTGISKQWKNCVTLGGFKNLGMVENVYNFNIQNYFIDSATKLSHESLMNIINNLYDRAAAGYSNLSLKFGSFNLAKLTAEEIAIATNKGWTLK